MHCKMRTKILIPLAFGLLLASNSLFAQREETVLGWRGLGLSGGWGGWTNSLTQFDEEYSVMSGGFGGLEFGKTLLIGTGGYHLATDVINDPGANQKMDLNYGGLMLGYGINSWRAVHPTITVLGGGGTVKLQNEGSDHIYVVQPQAGIEINVVRWFHLGLEGGYRFVGDSDFASLSDKRLSGPFGEVRLKFGYSFGGGRNHKKMHKKIDND